MPAIKWLDEYWPVLMFAGIWVLFMWQYSRKNGPAQRSFAEMKRHNDLLEKLLAGHDERLRLLEEERKRH